MSNTASRKGASTERQAYIRLLALSQRNKQMLKIIKPEPEGKINCTETKFTWEISNFSTLISDNRVHRSPSFNAHNLSFEISLRANIIHECENNISIDVQGPLKESNLLVEISLLKNEGLDEDFHFVLARRGNIDSTKKKLFKQDDVLRECVKDGILRVVCTMTNALSTPDIVDIAPRKRLKLCLEAVDSFQKLFNDKKFSDVMFCVEGRNILVQKSILTYKSPVFARMFSGNTLENKSGAVHIIDSTYDAMFALLKYAYTGITKEHLSLDCETSLDVLIAAEKYQLEFLKQQIQEIIIDKITNDNVLKCLSVADLNNAGDLKKQAIDHIVLHSQDIIQLPNFKELVKSYPELSCELFHAMSMRIVKSVTC